MNTERRPVYEFGAFRFDANGGCLLKDGTLVPLPPKVASLLEVLLEHRGSVVAKSELMDILWPDTFVQEESLHVYVFELRRALGQRRGREVFVETVPRRGYRFACAVTERRESEDAQVHDGQPRAEETYPVNNLRRPMTSLIGRPLETEQVASIVRAHRLATLTGTGGIGKSRLAMEVAARTLEDFADGTWIFELAPITDPHLVASTIASVLEAKDEPDSTPDAVIRKRLGSSRALLVLDNCDQVIKECAQLTARLLEGCPNVHVLATSHQPLAVEGESVFAVPPLSIPHGPAPASPDECASFDSVRLFRDRAVLTSPGFELDKHNARSVAEICQHLDGIPLAIELAAARVRVLAVDQILAMLDHRFRLLTGGSRGALTRHRTLRAAIDWSCDLLEDRQRLLFTRLSVFVGGFTLEAAEEVCSDGSLPRADIFTELSGLVSKSLVTAELIAGSTRFQMLETIRAYAREMLLRGNDDFATVRAHALWCAKLGGEALTQANGPNRDAWNVRLETEHDNIRAALRWSLREDNAPEIGMRLAGSLFRFWITLGFLNEGRMWLDLASLAPAAAVPALRALVLGSLANVAFVQADHDAALEAANASLALYSQLGDRAGAASITSIKALIVGRLGDYDRAYQLQSECLAVNQELGRVDDAKQCVFYLGLLAMYGGDFERAEAHFIESLEHYRATDNRHRVVVLLHNLGEIAWFRHDPASAVTMLEECLEHAVSLDLRRLMADTLRSLGRAVGDIGDGARAASLLERSANVQRLIGNSEGVIEVVEAGACIAAANGDAERAVTLAAAAVAHRDRLRIPPDRGFQRELEARLSDAVCRSGLMLDALAASRAMGSGLDLDAAVALIRSECGNQPY